MMEGEFHSLSAIKTIMPDFAPQPYGWGQYKEAPGTYFLIMEFLDLRMEMPDPATFTKLAVELHQKSESPTGMFGFHVPTCHGKIVQANSWDENWCRYFTRLLTSFLEADIGTNGPYPGCTDAFSTLTEHVVPRLLEPLQVNGRVLKPSLIHGDLWKENTGTNLKTGNPVVYDPSAFYAHHEYELGQWRRAIIKFDQPYFEHYFRQMPASEPAREWDDRNRLYSIKFNLAHAIGWSGESDDTRKLILEDVLYLNNKYAPDVVLQ
jgi:fructosamine-3-kinase